MIRHRDPFSTNQPRSLPYRTHTFAVLNALHAKRKAAQLNRRVIPAIRDTNDYFLELQNALAASRKAKTPREHALSRFQLVKDYFKERTASPKPTGKTHHQGQEFLGPNTPEVKRARHVSERLFLVQPAEQNWQRVEVAKNPGGTNACVTWDGVVILEQGVLQSSYSDDTLAYIIAHEMAHHLLQHVKQSRPGWRRYIILCALYAFFTDLMSFSSILLVKAIKKHLKNCAMFQAQEFEADDEATKHMWKAGYNGEACIKFAEASIERCNRLGITSKFGDKPELDTHLILSKPYDSFI
ncbi:hypothetical protein SBOR_8281 [Sclerotinia borealis F-4128]|uniref:Peptidase M48 domain-containing protein n=1 Tax=Sclerotinia borealis (strain F-4128) TaxID=1432307 RepID=W9C9Y6_SCLBF|nr:hypothetical protein SBOR_8281 [Sclerotinia borealis F-4128]